MLETSVSAPATARLQWFKDSQPLQGATLPSVSIPAAKATDAGLYRLTGFLPDGRSSSIELRLEVRIPPPQIVLQPQGGRFAEGTADAVLVAEAAWVDRFQWYFNGSLLPDATNSTLKLPLLRPANSGAYTVRVTGTGGVEIVSEAATVEVVRQTPGGAVWRFKAGDAIASSPAIGADGTLFVGSDDTRVHAIDGSTGTERWSFQTGGRVTASPTVGPDDTVYVGSEDTRIYALDGATGTKRWDYPTGGAVVASPAMGVDGTIYVGSQDTKVHAIHGKSGARRWEYPTGAAIRSSPALGVDGTVYVGSVDGWVHALDGATGTNRWKFATGGAIHGSPALGADGTVYLGRVIARSTRCPVPPAPSDGSMPPEEPSSGRPRSARTAPSISAATTNGFMPSMATAAVSDGPSTPPERCEPRRPSETTGPSTWGPRVGGSMPSMR